MSTSLRSWRRSYTRAARGSQLGERRVIRAPLAGPGHMTAPRRPPLTLWRPRCLRRRPAARLSLRRGLGALPTRLRLRLALMCVTQQRKQELFYIFCTRHLLACIACSRVGRSSRALSWWASGRWKSRAQVNQKVTAATHNSMRFATRTPAPAPPAPQSRAETAAPQPPPPSPHPSPTFGFSARCATAPASL